VNIKLVEVFVILRELKKIYITPSMLVTFLHTTRTTIYPCTFGYVLMKLYNHLEVLSGLWLGIYIMRALLMENI
jgi:hypothetical protein